MIKSYQDWMNKTNTGVFSVRSPQLKDGDRAVKTYFNRNDLVETQPD